MKSAHSCTLSNEFKHFSTCWVYFLYFGSFTYAGGGGAIRIDHNLSEGTQWRTRDSMDDESCHVLHGERLPNSPSLLNPDGLLLADITKVLEGTRGGQRGCGMLPAAGSPVGTMGDGVRIVRHAELAYTLYAETAHRRYPASHTASRSVDRKQRAIMRRERGFTIKQYDTTVTTGICKQACDARPESGSRKWGKGGKRASQG